MSVSLPIFISLCLKDVSLDIKISLAPPNYSMMARVQYLALRIDLFVDDSFSNFFGEKMGFFMFMILFFMFEIMIYKLKRKYYSTVQTYVRLNSWDHLGAWDQLGPHSSQTQ